MKKIYLLIILLLISINLYSAPPDSCLKVYNNYLDSTFTNPYLVKVDSCSNSPNYGEFYGKEFFLLNFHYNIIPRDYIASEDTIIEYTWQDILPIYNDDRDAFYEIEQKFGNFKFKENFPNNPDTTITVKRSLSLIFDNYVNIDSAEKALSIITSVRSSLFYGWFKYLTSFEYEIETQNQFLIYPNPAGEFIEFKNSLDFFSKEIFIYDIYGRMVQQTTYNNSPVNITELPKGCYIVRVNYTTFQFIKH
jgi:hypothetical protein